jgi:amidohydrolase
LEGTIRTLDVDMQADLHNRLLRTATNIAEASGASAEVEIIKHVPITFNNPELVTKMGPTMKRVCGEDNVSISRAATASEDFAFFANEIPCFFFSLGGMTKGRDPKTVGPHHTPDFFIDESGLKLGVRVLSNLVLDYSTKIGK